MKYMLVVLFYLGGPQPQFVDGFLPLFFNTYEECEARRVEVSAYFKSQSTFPPVELNCYKREAKGTDS
jgi:hypothetical protein